MKICFRHLFFCLNTIVFCSIPFLGCSCSKQTIVPISIEKSEKTKTISTTSCDFVFQTQNNYFSDGVTFNVIDSLGNRLEIVDSTINNESIVLTISLSDHPTKSTTYNFGIKFNCIVKKTEWTINDLTINYVEQPKPDKPFIKCPDYTEKSCFLIDDDFGGIEVVFPGFSYTNLSSIDNLSVKGTFDFPDSNFDYFIDAKGGNKFDVIIKSPNFSKVGTYTGYFTFYFNSKEVESDGSQFIVDVYNKRVDVPDACYTYVDKDENGILSCTITGIHDVPSNCNSLNFPYAHVLGDKVYPLVCIDKYAFVNIREKYRNLKYLSFEKAIALKTIGNSAFMDCELLVGDLYFPQSLQIIGNSAFRNCNLLGDTLNIPNNVNDIGACAFEGCYNFSKLNIFELGSIPSWTQTTYDPITKKEVPNNVFKNLAETGVVYVKNNPDVWKKVLINQCALPKNWDVKVWTNGGDNA